MVDPATEIVEARDQNTGAVRLLLREEVEADRARFQGVEVRKKPGHTLVLTGDEAARLDWGRSSATRRSSKDCTGCAAS